jgi:hypothetical protein
MLVLLMILQPSNGFSQPGWSRNTPGGSSTCRVDKLSAVPIEGYEEAFRIVDQCAESGDLSPALNDAVRFLEVNSYRIYPATNPEHTEQLWQTAQGSWKLVASTGSHKCRQFHPTPWFLPFSFAMIDGTHFGNGIGLDANRIGLAFLHHAHFHAPHRRMTVTHPDLYFRGRRVEFPDFLRPAVLKVVESEDNNTQEAPKAKPAPTVSSKPVPTFVLVGASEKTLIARGNQSGGLALWVRLPQDMRVIAYQEYPKTPSPPQEYHLMPQ